MDLYEDYDCPAKEALQISSISEAQPRPIHSIGNEPDPFVVYFTVRLREKSLQDFTRDLLRPGDLVNILGGRPKSITFNFVKDMVVQIQNEEQSSILSRVNHMGEFDVEVTPHQKLNNVTGVIESEILWNEGSNKKVVRQLAHEGVVVARILHPIILQDGRKSFSVVVTLKNRSRLPLFVTTLQGAQLDVRVIVLPPRQCLNCFRYGHESFNCRERGAICENCSDFRGDHGQPCFRMTRCANCSSRRHGALSRRCFALYKSWRINIVGCTESLTFMNAKKSVDDEVQDCLRRGGDYREEFPLTSRYFLVIPPDAFPGPHSATPGNTSTNCVSCDYPEYRLGSEPGDTQTLPALLDYYSNHAPPRGSPTPFGNVSPLCSPAHDTNWSSPVKLYQSETRLPERHRSSEYENFSPSSSPMYKSSSISTNTADTISVDSENDIIEPMLDVIDANNRFSNKILDVDVLHKANIPIGLSKFLATNLKLVSCCWVDEVRSHPRKLKVSKVSADNGGVQCNDYANGGYSNNCDMDTRDYFTDKLSLYRCRNYVSGKRCNGQCMKLHRLPKEDGVWCLHYQFSRCTYGRTCHFLHVPSNDCVKQAFRFSKVSKNYFSHCDRDRLETRSTWYE